MEPFTFNRQTIAFLCVIAAVELLVVLLFSLIAAMLGALAVLLLLFVWVKTGIRSGKWFWWNPVAVPLTQLEGALAVSGAFLLAIGVIDVGYEWIKLPPHAREVLIGHVSPTIGGPPPSSSAGSNSAMYTDPAVQEQFKDELAKAGIPYGMETRGRDEYVFWSPQYDSAVKKIEGTIGAGPISGYNMSFGDPKQQREFRGWLLKRGIASEIIKIDGKDFVVWKEGSQELAHQFINEHSAPCARGKPASAPGKEKAPRC